MKVSMMNIVAIVSVLLFSKCFVCSSIRFSSLSFLSDDEDGSNSDYSDASDTAADPTDNSDDFGSV